MSAELISKSKYQLGLSLLSKYPFCCIFFCKQDLKAVEAASRQEFSCHCFLGSASLPNRTLKVQKTSASLLCFHRGAQKAQKKNHIKCQIYTPKAGYKMMREVVSILHRVLFTRTSFNGFVQAKEKMISSGCSTEQQWFALFQQPRVSSLASLPDSIFFSQIRSCVCQ